MSNSEMQYRTRAQIIPTSEGKALGVGFWLGPIHVYVIVNMPEEGKEEGPLAYIRLDLRTIPNNQVWEASPTHSMEFRKRSRG